MGKKNLFQPGQSGNPNGRPKLPPEIKEARKLTATALELRINEFLKLNPDELTEIINSPKSVMLDLMIAKIIAEAVTKGDQVRLDFVLSRIGLPTKQHIKIDMPKPTIIKRFESNEEVQLISLSKQEDEEE